MTIILAISQALLYFSLAILMGTFILRVVPAAFRPDIAISNRWLYGSAVIIPIATFIPVLNIVTYIAPRLGFFKALEIVLLQHTVGLAWAASFLVSSFILFILLFATAKEKLLHKGINFLLAFNVVLVILTVAWASHAASIQQPLGMVSDTIHLLAVSIWVGILLIVAWFATEYKNWVAFLTWFSIVAISCLGATVISGFLLLDVLVNDYVDSWMVTYGQGLLIKHLLMLPVIFYAAFNGLYVKFKVAKNPEFNPSLGVKIESLFLFAIFTVTAYFSQNSPPHGHYKTEDAISPLFKLMHDGQITASSYVGFISNPIAVAFIFGCILFFAAIIIGLIKRFPMWLQLLITILFVMMVYLTLMLSVAIK